MQFKNWIAGIAFYVVILYRPLNLGGYKKLEDEEGDKSA